MKPVLILQHLSGDGPAYLGRWLAGQGIPHEVRDTEAGQPYPAGMDGHAALAVLGGEWSANDPLDSLRHAERLILQAMDAGKPVIGHCLGGQLMARALGARVIDSPAPEIGWQPLQVLDNAVARDWFGEPGTRDVFQWHHEAFELPAGATLLARSAACPHQAFSLGPHLAMQFHVEIDGEKLARWSHGGCARDRQAAHLPTVQGGAAMREGALKALAAHHRLADRLYRRWIDGARGG